MKEELKIDPETNQIKSIGPVPDEPAQPEPKYACPNHGQHEKTMVLSLEKVVVGVYCLHCYKDFLDKALGQMQVLK